MDTKFHNNLQTCRVTSLIIKFVLLYGIKNCHKRPGFVINQQALLSRTIVITLF